MNHNIYLYILVAAGVSSLIRILPMTLIRGKIENKFVRSFLFYLPYITLSVMTFPAIVEATEIPAAGILALAVAVVAAWVGADLFGVAVISCAVVFVIELAAKFIF